MRHIFFFMLLALSLAASPALGAEKSAAKAEPAKQAVSGETPKKPLITTTEEVEKVGAGLQETEITKAAKTGKFTMAIGDPEDSEMGLLGIAFQNHVAQASQGKMSVRLSYNGGLDADETFQFHRVQTGKLDMAMGGVGNITPMIRRLGVVTLPYIFPNAEAVVRGTTGKAAKLLNSYAEEAGLYILAWTYYGYRYLSNSKRPIKSLADIKGLRFRVPQSMVMIKTYRAFGANPVPVAWLATRSALRNDLVDGQCYDYSGFRTMKFLDAGQKYITEIHYLYNLQPLVINLKLFQALTPEERKVLVDAGHHIQTLSQQYQTEMNAVAKQALISAGAKITTVADESEWRQAALAEVWPDAVDMLGGMDAVNKYLALCDLPLWHPGKDGKSPAVMAAPEGQSGSPAENNAKSTEKPAKK